MTVEIITVFTIVIVVIALLVIDRLRIDIVALLCLLALTWSGILEGAQALSGFSSNAVVAMLSVMIMGRGIARTGIMDRFSNLVARVGGSSQNRIVAIFSASAGLLSGFIQNIGAVVIFLPSVLNISRRIEIPASSLIMPIGAATILGGTLTMIGSGPLIMVNDLLKTASLEPYGMFAVTPVGICLLASGMLFFLLAGRFVLPRRSPSKTDRPLQKILVETWNLPEAIIHYHITQNSPLVGITLEESSLWDKYHLHILAINKEGTMEYAPWRNTRFAPAQTIALLGNKEDIDRFAADYSLQLRRKPGRLRFASEPESAGFAEIIIPPRSGIIGKSLRVFGLRKNYGVEPIALFHAGRKTEGDFSDISINAGDTLIIHGTWQNIARLKNNNDFVLVTPVSAETKTPSRTIMAVSCFAMAIILTFTGLPISIAFLSGAVAMILTRVIDIDEAYQAIDWKAVFFLAGLIPLSIAMEKTGAAFYLAAYVMDVVHGSHMILVLLTVALLATAFSLFMSNVAATVILAPLVINMAHIGGYDPAAMVLLVAVCCANSFILPTHQVNVMLKSQGGYTNFDYLKAGGGMTIVFLVIVTGAFYLLYF